MLYLLLIGLSFTLEARELKLLTWNTFLIPPPINVTKQKARVEQMGEILPSLSYDVIFFQETFFIKQRKKLISALKSEYPYILTQKKKRAIHQFLDSGLMIASKRPLKLLEEIIFQDCAKSDCASSKGAILVELKLEDQTVQFINTHMQAWNEAKTIRVRQLQLAQIKELLRRHYRPGIPQILVGDLNIDGKSMSEFPAAVAFMEMSAGKLVGELDASNGFSTAGCYKRPGANSPPEWLDHVWIKSNDTKWKVNYRKIVPLMGRLNHRHCPLSDHHGVEAILSYE